MGGHTLAFTMSDRMDTTHIPTSPPLTYLDHEIKSLLASRTLSRSARKVPASRALDCDSPVDRELISLLLVKSNASPPTPTHIRSQTEHDVRAAPNPSTPKRPCHISHYSDSTFVFSRTNSRGCQSPVALTARELRLHAFTPVSLFDSWRSGEADRARRSDLLERRTDAAEERHSLLRQKESSSPPAAMRHKSSPVTAQYASNRFGAQHPVTSPTSPALSVRSLDDTTLRRLSVVAPISVCDSPEPVPSAARQLSPLLLLPEFTDIRDESLAIPEYNQVRTPVRPRLLRGYTNPEGISSSSHEARYSRLYRLPASSDGGVLVKALAYGSRRKVCSEDVGDRSVEYATVDSWIWNIPSPDLADTPPPFPPSALELDPILKLDPGTSAANLPYHPQCESAELDGRGETLPCLPSSVSFQSPIATSDISFPHQTHMK